MYHSVGRVVALLVAQRGEPFAGALVRRVALDLGASGGMFTACGDHVVQDGPHVPILLHAPGPPPSAGGALYNVIEVAEGGCIVNPQM